MSLKSQIQQLLAEHDITPNKVLGQNFLINEDVVRLFVESANITKDDVVVEVGPGTGIITKELAKHAGQVLAVEKDPYMVRILQDELKELKNVRVINEDILKFQITNNPETNKQTSNDSNQTLKKTGAWKLVGAIPYYLTGRLFRKFLEETENRPELISVIIQKEVAEKITAKPPKMNLLAISVQLYGVPKIIKKVPKEFFWPRPKVDSAILAVENIKKPEVDGKKFFKVVRAGFSAPRKQLISNLSKKLDISREEAEKVLKKCDVEPQRRAETLSVEEWIKLTSKL